jgi:hypothetical protein
MAVMDYKFFNLPKYLLVLIRCFPELRASKEDQIL